MYVNAFWFGVLLTVVGLIVLLFIIAFITMKRNEAEEGAEDMLMDEDAFKKMLSEAVRDALRENVIFGEPVEDRDDEAH